MARDPRDILSANMSPTMLRLALSKPAVGAATQTSPAGSGPGWGDISGYFEKALAGLTGAASDVEKSYQGGKRRTMSDIAMQSINAGMANTLNMPAAGIAYDEANRPATNMAVANAKAGIYGDMGKTAAGIYGENLGAETQRYGIDVGASTSRSNASLDFASSAANRQLQKYLGELEMKYKMASLAPSSGSATTLGRPQA